MLASGAAEVVSLLAAVPFLEVLTDPQRIWMQPLLKGVAVQLGITNINQLKVLVTLGFGLVSVLSAAVRLLNLWANGRLAAAIGSDLSCEAYKRTLYQPYSVHVMKNSSGLIAAISTHVEESVVVVKSTLQLTTSSVVALGILMTLLTIDWQVACLAIVVFLMAYSLLSIILRRRLRSNGRLVASSQEERIRSLQEGLGAIRDVLLDGSQRVFLEIYQRADQPMRLRLAQNIFLKGFPRYALEALGLLLIALLGLLLSLQRDESLFVITILGTLAFGFQRLLPSLQQIYASWASINSVASGVEQVLDLLNQPLQSHSLIQNIQPLQLRNCIEVSSLRFQYDESSPLVLNGVDVKINRGEKIGIMGITGSGKSTLVDLLMGLLDPTSGQIFIDGLDLHDFNHPERLFQWRASIAHVPQTIFLSDSSIADNIAFGLPRDMINYSRVIKAAKQARIHDFIESSPQGYDTFVGERGVRLSGGQRQRLGIARALYKQAKVVILDEATSALDNETEASVMDSIHQLDSKLTVVIIAHRLNTLSKCDRVIRLDKGFVVADGPPSDVLV